MSHRLPPLNGLRAFEAAARHASFVDAARELGVSPGAVSRQVRRLEAALGVPLFERLAHGIRPTAAAAAYRPELSAAFRIISRATEAVAPALAGRKLRIGVSADLRALLPPAWPEEADDLAFHLARPVVTSDVDLIAAGALDGLLQLARTRTPGLSNEAVARIERAGVRSDVYFIAPAALSGCVQSRALVRSIGALFSDAR